MLNFYTNKVKKSTAEWVYTPASFNASLCTHVMYAFANLNGNTIGVNDDFADINQGGYSQVVGLKSKNSNLKTMISVGGGGAVGFSSMASSSANINTFVTSVVAFLKKYKFDGLDVDWEVPLTAEKAAFSNLLTALRQAFGTTYLLSVATASIPPYDDAGNKWNKMTFYKNRLRLCGNQSESRFFKLDDVRL